MHKWSKQGMPEEEDDEGGTPWPGLVVPSVVGVCLPMQR